jgi:cap1 methyltransferase
MKMANLDHLFNLLPEYPDDIINPFTSVPEFMYADICAGPGGFTEYVCFRSKGMAKGYG